MNQPTTQTDSNIPNEVVEVSYAWEAYTNTFDMSKPVPPENIFCAWCGIRQSAVGNPMRHSEWHDEVDRKLEGEL